MFPHLASMSLAGWSNQFVDESLWDCDDGANGKSPACVQAGNSSGIPNNSLVALFRQSNHTVPPGHETSSQDMSVQPLFGRNEPAVYGPFSDSCTVPKSPRKGIPEMPSKGGLSIKANMLLSPKAPLEERLSKTHNVINEVLQNLSQVIDLDDSFDDDLLFHTHKAPIQMAPPRRVAGFDTALGFGPNVASSWNPATNNPAVAYSGTSAPPTPPPPCTSASTLAAVSPLSTNSTHNNLHFSSFLDRNERIVDYHTALSTRQNTCLTPENVESIASYRMVAQQPTLTDDQASDDDDYNENRFRDYQNKQWDEAFEDLLAFRKVRGNCQVPHGFKENPPLSRWVKRQRYQYKLMKEGKPSTMTEERIQRLEAAGFVWDSHNTIWEHRIAELEEFRRANGHVTVPTAYNQNKKLATWVKQQRRQYKLFCLGRPSNITLERIEQLQSMGFEWCLRARADNKKKA